MNNQQTLDGYSRSELHKIVDIYNLGFDLKKLQKNKEELLKEMKKIPKKKLVDLPLKEDLKKHKLKKKVPPVKEGQKNIKDFFNSTKEEKKDEVSEKKVKKIKFNINKKEEKK